jgi:hypothetical protein
MVLVTVLVMIMMHGSQQQMKELLELHTVKEGVQTHDRYSA